MGMLVEGEIKTFFHGVSRQPDSVRLPGQLEDGLNAIFTVESGGFTKRFGSRHVAKIAGISSTEKIGIHPIDRDLNERYIVVLRNGSLRVLDLNGTEKTVNALPADAVSYLSTDPDNLVCITVADYTFILNKTKVVAMDAVTAPPPFVWLSVAINYSGAGTGSLDINGTRVATVTSASTDTSSIIANSFYTQLVTNLGPGGWGIYRDDNFLFIHAPGGVDFTANQASPVGTAGMSVVKDSVSSTSSLPARAPNAMKVKVQGTSGSGYYLQFNAQTGSFRGVWTETVQPGTQIRINKQTMPYSLVRETNGTFSLRAVTWDDKAVGDTITVPSPDFVGRTISDVVFHRNRLALIADETVFFSRAGDYFNFWPERSTEVLDSDPFGVTATTNAVAILRYAVPFRKALFASADKTQFEVSSPDLLTPKKTSIDLSTSYAISPRCRPIGIGDELYMAAESGDEAVILEYLYRDSSLSNVATDITKHCKGFVPTPVVRMVGDSVTGSVWALSDAARDSLYVYTFFWNGDERAQSAWHRWQFVGSYVHGMMFVSGFLYVVLRRDGDTFIERITVGVQDYKKYTIAPRLDREVRLSNGVYDSATGRTTWTLPYAAADIKALTSSDFGGMRDIAVTNDSGNAWSARGDWSGGEVMFGVEFPSTQTLSKVYPRDGQGAAIITGRLQLRSMTLSFVDTGYFEVHVTPSARDTRVKKFTGRKIGSARNVIGSIPIENGTLKVRVGSRGDTATITISNPTFMPHTITSAAWTGLFNEVTRQG